jgi:hypothetical protein
MPANKDFKRLIRGRMRKTGESYTAARAHLLSPSTPPAAPARAPAPDYATLAGRSDASLKAATGCTWERWVKALDHVDADTWSHRDIAKYVRERYKVDGWWAQSVTVGYERIKGLRVIGQRRDGSFEATRSRTFAAPLTRLYRAFADSASRERWLPGIELAIRTATRGKSMRITWPDRSSVSVGFTSRGRGKSQVAVQHERLPDRAAATRLKQFWTERLEALGQLLHTTG